MRHLSLLILFLALGITGCQQNPYPSHGYLRKAPVESAQIARDHWAEDQMTCVEKYSRKDFPLPIALVDKDAQLEVAIEPAEMNAKVEWIDQTLFVLSDSNDKEGSHHFKLIAKTKRDGYRTAEIKESFFYEVKDRCEEASR